MNLCQYVIIVRKYFYPIVSNLKIYSKYKKDHDLKISNILSERIICLPIYPTLNACQKKYIVDKVIDFLI